MLGAERHERTKDLRVLLAMEMRQPKPNTCCDSESALHFNLITH